MIEPDKDRQVYQVWTKDFNNSKLKVGDVIEDILLPRQAAMVDERYFEKTWRFRLWRAKLLEIGLMSFDFGTPETYIIPPDDERVLDCIKTRYALYDMELRKYNER